MFSYYGSKSKIIKWYPKPRFSTIVEPFAGSGYYSYTYGLDKDVWLNDKYDKVYKLWKYLISCTEEEILSLPDIKKGDDIRKFNLTEEQSILLGFSVGGGRPQPGYTVTSFADPTSHPKEDTRWRPTTILQRTKKRIIEVLPYIRNWKITNLDYRELPDIEATWYIDPPYIQGGSLYVENRIDYQELAEWCKSRKGQVIVCENGNASYLPFKPLVTCHGQKHKTKEVIWTNYD